MRRTKMIKEITDNAITMTCKGKEMLKLCDTGDIYVKGVLCENNKEVVQAAFEWFVLAKEDVINCPKCGHQLLKTDE